MTEVRRVLCKVCRQMRPISVMHYEYGGTIYCSAGCAARAQWQFGPIPMQRDHRG